MNSYNQVDQQFHILSQVIAKANRTYVPKKKDDSHTNLALNEENGLLEGRWIDAPKGKVVLALRISDMCFVWLDENREVFQTVSSAKKEIDEIEQTLKQGIERSGLDTQGFTDPMHYEIPEYSATGKPVQLLMGHAINEWKFWRGLANHVSRKILRTLNEDEEIRIWPHHFDTGIYVKRTEKMGLGFGLAMKDEMTGAPYFYLSGYGNKKDIEYTGLPELEASEWKITKNFEGAVLRLSELSREITADQVLDHFKPVLKWYMELVGKM